MCGICGFTGKQDKQALKKMTDSLYHRGPDEDGFYSDGKINLGVRRLSIIDLETGHQPVHNEDRSIWGVFNGEIYNFHELRKTLKESGHSFYTDHSDSEVIVHAYEEYGADFANRFNGMFAIALWDSKKEALLLLRDRMGVKPLFYAMLGNCLVFGSEIKSILSHPGYLRDINYEAVYHYFTFKNIPAPLTAFKGIYSLSPGDMLSFSNGTIKKDRWWRVLFKENQDSGGMDAEKKILELLEDATRLRMRSDVPFGAYLSGGIDSSAIVALMTKFSSGRIKTFSLGYEDNLKNKEEDLFYARKIARLYNTEHQEYVMSSRELVEDAERVSEAFDQPFSGTISTYFLTKLIARHVKVALSGDGSDELFGSYLSHRVAQPMYHYARLYNKARSDTLEDEERNLFKPCDVEFLDGLFERSGGDEARWRYDICLFSDQEKDNLLNREFKARAGHASSLALLNGYFGALTARDPLNRILEMEWNTQLPDQVLAFVDFLSMAHSVEIRSPFLDYRLVEFMATIPGGMKIRNGNVKDILKRAVGQLLPEEITNRPKEGFVLPVFDWMTEKLRDYVEETLSEKRLKRHGLLNYDAVRDILKSYYAGDRSLAARIWNLAMFQVWWDRYFG